MNGIGAEMWQALVVLVSAVFTQNILLAYFLGLCPFIGVSREIKTSFGLGLAVIFVITCTTLLNWLAYHYVLVPLGLEFFRFILFIIIIAAFVQFVEMTIERYSTTRSSSPSATGSAVASAGSSPSWRWRESGRSSPTTVFRAASRVPGSP
jgi:Na+-transporting NADH:ubiquinone oxidoreductase subunit NqrD